MLAWLVDERGIEPHVKVFDKSEVQMLPEHACTQDRALHP
jgi:hypothetical protein